MPEWTMWNRKFKQKKKEDPKKKFFRYEAIEWCSVLALRRRCVSCAPLTRWENVGNKNTTVYVSFFSCSPLTLYSISFIYQNFGIGHKPGAQSNEQLSCIQRISFSCWMFHFRLFSLHSFHRFACLYVVNARSVLLFH